MYRWNYFITCLLIAGIVIGFVEDRLDYSLISSVFLIALLLVERALNVVHERFFEVDRDMVNKETEIYNQIDDQIRILQRQVDDLNSK